MTVAPMSLDAMIANARASEPSMAKVRDALPMHEVERRFREIIRGEVLQAIRMRGYRMQCQAGATVRLNLWAPGDGKLRAEITLSHARSGPDRWSIRLFAPDRREDRVFSAAMLQHEVLLAVGELEDARAKHGSVDVQG